MSEILRGKQVTVEVNHFKSKMLRANQMIVGVIHFMSELLRGTQVTNEVNHFKS